MNNSRELERLLRRAERVRTIQAPPTLTMPVVMPGEEAPEPEPWQMIVYVEPKVAY